MSEEQLKAFMEAVKADEALKAKLKEAKSAADVVGIAKQTGFTFSAEELESAQKAERDGVSDAELENAAGGEGGFCIPAIAVVGSLPSLVSIEGVTTRLSDVHRRVVEE